MKTFAAAKLNLWLGMLLILGAGAMLLFDLGSSSSAAALLVIGICNLVIGLSVKKEGDQ